jgi:hypothetical protein
MKKLSKLLAAQACAIAVLASPLAQASLVKVDDGSFRDTDTGYLWRTLGQYDGMDYGTAVNALPTGYHVASEAELATLTTAAPVDSTNPAVFDQLAAVMGASYDPDNPMIWGFYGDGTRYAWTDDWEDTWTSNAANASGWADADTGLVPAGFSDPYLSIFAVDTAAAQTSVPEPATLALVGLGLAGIARRSRAGKPARQA